MNGRIGSWFQTYTGIKFYPLDPRPEDISVHDIAHSTSMIVRGTGHLKFMYTVGEHSLNTYKLLKQQGYDEKIQIIGLLHDSSECYCNDLNTILKQYLSEYKLMENRIQEVIWEAFDIDVYEDEYAIVKKADKMLLQWEAEHNMIDCLWNDKSIVLPNIQITERPRSIVKEEFLDTFWELKSKMTGGKLHI
ncbi:hypothetical protein [Brevibacillus porteri]|uniref:hypothetical protein n=1 Tax=Brevibacillus porteri TaxID=2126350 RepID=UPI00362EB543